MLVWSFNSGIFIETKLEEDKILTQSLNAIASLMKREETDDGKNDNANEKDDTNDKKKNQNDKIHSKTSNGDVLLVKNDDNEASHMFVQVDVKYLEYSNPSNVFYCRMRRKKTKMMVFGSPIVEDVIK